MIQIRLDRRIQIGTPFDVVQFCLVTHAPRRMPWDRRPRSERLPPFARRSRTAPAGERARPGEGRARPAGGKRCLDHFFQLRGSQAGIVFNRRAARCALNSMDRVRSPQIPQAIGSKVPFRRRDCGCARSPGFWRAPQKRLRQIKFSDKASPRHRAPSFAPRQRQWTHSFGRRPQLVSIVQAANQLDGRFTW